MSFNRGGSGRIPVGSESDLSIHTVPYGSHMHLFEKAPSSSFNWALVRMLWRIRRAVILSRNHTPAFVCRKQKEYSSVIHDRSWSSSLLIRYARDLCYVLDCANWFIVFIIMVGYLQETFDFLEIKEMMPQQARKHLEAEFEATCCSPVQFKLHSSPESRFYRDPVSSHPLMAMYSEDRESTYPHVNWPFNFTCTSTQGTLLDVRTTNELISLQSLIGTRVVNNVTITGTSSPVTLSFNPEFLPQFSGIYNCIDEGQTFQEAVIITTGTPVATISSYRYYFVRCHWASILY